MSRRWIEAYYWVTPLFALADGVFGANVRAAGLAGHAELRAVYYVLCLACAAAVHVRPALAGLVGFAESSLNLLILVLSLMLPYYGMLADAAVGGVLPVESPISPGRVMNFMIAGSVWVFVFESHLLRLQPGRRRPA